MHEWTRHLASVAHGVFPRVLPRVLERLGLVCLPELGHVILEGVVRVGGGEQGLGWGVQEVM